MAAGLAAVLGLGAFVVGLALAGRRRETAASSVWSALAAALAGWSVACVGLALSNVVLVVAGAVLGTAAFVVGGLIARAAGRSLGALMGGAPALSADSGYPNIRACGSEEAATMLEQAARVVIIPGFGMAAAQAQHAVKEVAEQLVKRGAEVIYAIHPAAGCVPGHMNIALDEANVPREMLRDLGAVGPELGRADAVLVVGANDVVNPGSRDAGSPVQGMDAPDLTAARNVFVFKRSLRPGTLGVRNALFEQPNATMVFGDAKKVMQGLVAQLKGGGGH
jgi:NAD(P) transhydrogenase subunit beta